MAGFSSLFGMTLLSAGELPDGGILSLDMSLIVGILVQAVNVIVLIAALTYVLYKPVLNFMKQRQLRIKEEIESAQRIRDEAMELKEKYQKLIDNIEKEREELLRQTHKKAMEKSDQLLFEARREVEVIHDRANAEIEMERQNIQDEMKRQIIEIACAMASKFVQVSIDQDTQDKYIGEALTEWEGGLPDA